MIITPDSDVKDVKQLDIVVNRASVHEDPPPEYVGPGPQPPSQPSAAPPPPPPPSHQTQPPPPNVKPTNFLSLSRSNNTIKGTYVIDPRIQIPAAFLPPLAADEPTESVRRNLALRTSNGMIDVDLYVVGGGDGDVKQPSPVTILLRSSNGNISARLRTCTPSTSTATPAAHPPLRLTVRTSNGSITLRLPRAFRGPLTVRTRNGAVRFVGALAGAVTEFGEEGGVRRCFVGEFGDYAAALSRPLDAGSKEAKGGKEWGKNANAADAWPGDELTLESSNGGIKLLFDDEGSSDDDQSQNSSIDGKGKGSGFFGKLLGR
ncbi:hypothetical protein B0H11DRAFT_1804739 [Mycena galericulata]|nr:hypothetical protein B0H11DRAFT_1804739 [Mycena galericulata]